MARGALTLGLTPSQEQRNIINKAFREAGREIQSRSINKIVEYICLVYLLHNSKEPTLGQGK